MAVRHVLRQYYILYDRIHVYYNTTCYIKKFYYKEKNGELKII